MEAVLFDLGKVLLDWNPRYYYAQFFGQEADALEQFIVEVVSADWILAMDRGQTMDAAIAERRAAFPQHAELIDRWQEGWPEMLRGEIAGTVAILAELRARGTRLYALTNFSHETWPIARRRFPFLEWFEDIVVSGEVGFAKPDPRIFALAIERCRLDPPRTLFIDDLPANVEAARGHRLNAVQFVSPDKLRADLARLGLL